MNNTKFIGYFSRTLQTIGMSTVPRSRLRQICVAMILLFAWQMSSVAQPLVNQLKSSPSSYLAIHGDDPVARQEWSPATIELARKQNKLLFVSIGCFSCHWCHVMQAENYRHAEIAALINQHFIPVKVDRELELSPDTQNLYEVSRAPTLCVFTTHDTSEFA